ncbi:nitrous oxide-stimulated promoter family protein [Vibrio breoganii]|uniref:nitrous oxide-stimulated promoter family protein n=1 Tax=Vibrio breoganii TaxID=553239 RepID=UPI000C84AA2C|nr:nitrous oxide-stimulated promoter family protein [Vibrio breoganii]PMO80639.1 nitrous oxide-stimulated promoter [Vibrio breoganii]PMO86204.1 nitrous oxide-stimulated promoter [Vibrio breoganii]
MVLQRQQQLDEILSGELLKEYKTVHAMIEIYCSKHHGVIHGLCEECTELSQYAKTKLDRCVFGQNKPTCNRCPVHCYRPEPKENMRAVMRFSGPRMLLKHPLLAIRHLRHEKKAVPEVPKKNTSNRHLRKSSGKL